MYPFITSNILSFSIQTYKIINYSSRFLKNAKHGMNQEIPLNCLLLAANVLELMCEIKRIKIRS